MTNIGTMRDGGGTFERPFLLVCAYRDGCVARVETFDPDGEAEALACFERLLAVRGPRERPD